MHEKCVKMNVESENVKFKNMQHTNVEKVTILYDENKEI